MLWFKWPVSFTTNTAGHKYVFHKYVTLATKNMYVYFFFVAQKDGCCRPAQLEMSSLVKQTQFWAFSSVTSFPPFHILIWSSSHKHVMRTPRDTYKCDPWFAGTLTANNITLLTALSDWRVCFRSAAEIYYPSFTVDCEISARPSNQHKYDFIIPDCVCWLWPGWCHSDTHQMPRLKDRTCCRMTWWNLLCQFECNSCC